MNPASVDIKDLLVAEALGVYAATTGWGIFVSSQPTAPDTTITVYDLPSRTAGVLDKTSKIRYDNIEIRVRGTAYTTAWAKAIAVMDFLEPLYNFTQGGSKYETLRTFTGPTTSPKDEKGRFVFVIKFEAIRQAVS